MHEAWLDRTVEPCDDFYKYACGSWLANTPIPAEYPTWDTSFSPLALEMEKRIRKILEEDKPDENPAAKKLRDFYSACMDENAAETTSLAALKERLKVVDAIATPKDLARAVAEIHMESFEAVPLFGFGNDQDAKDATQMIGFADQNGISLPDRDFYLTRDKDHPRLLQAYREYVADMFALIGEPRSDADRVVAIETGIARAQVDRVQRRDPVNMYHRLDRKGLMALAPSFDWDAYFEAVGIPDVTAINVVTPEFFANGVEPIVGHLDAMKPYLKWFFLQRATPLLGKAFVDRWIAFRATVIGTTEQPPRWKRCVWMVNEVLPEAIGRSYVSRYFGAEQKARALELVHQIEGAFDKNLDSLAWMDATTRTRAREKLHAISNKIGFPDRWRDYAALPIDRATPLANFIAAATFESKRQLAFIGKPVDRSEMRISSQAVDANYVAAWNEMNFPAGILTPPFFGADAPETANFGGIGMVIGHELTHGFDDAGRKYDGKGNLRDWWTPGAATEYTRRASCVEKQYDGYVSVGDVHLNGALTLGENIADNGGLKLAYLAMHEGRSVSPDEDREFFTSFAQAWCTNQRPELAKLLTTIDPHSARQWRVNGSVSNMEAFQRAFTCKAGSKMAPANRCSLW